jgi:hypothetical protein
MTFSDHCLPLLCELHMFTYGIPLSLLLKSLHICLHTNSIFPMSLTSSYLIGFLSLEPPSKKLLCSSSDFVVLYFSLRTLNFFLLFQTLAGIFKVLFHYFKNPIALSSFKGTIVLMSQPSSYLLLFNSFSLFLPAKTQNQS